MNEIVFGEAECRYSSEKVATTCSEKLKETRMYLPIRFVTPRSFDLWSAPHFPFDRFMFSNYLDCSLFLRLSKTFIFKPKEHRNTDVCLLPVRQCRARPECQDATREPDECKTVLRLLAQQNIQEIPYLPSTSPFQRIREWDGRGRRLAISTSWLLAPISN